jgi:hypothetical protein
MFWLGFFVPVLWLIGAMIEPTAAKQREALGHGTA